MRILSCLIFFSIANCNHLSIEPEKNKHQLEHHSSQSAEKCIKVVKPIPDPSYDKVVFVDGIFDLPHFGHQNFIFSAQEKAAQVLKTDKEHIFVLVGISGTPDEIKAYKRASVYSYAEKKRELCGYKNVFRVINSPMVTTKKFMSENNIDLVIAGGDYEDLEKARKYYKDPIELGKFYTVKRHLKISTSDIMRRTSKRVNEVVKKRVSSQEDREIIDKANQLVKEDSSYILSSFIA